jgi:hypothetical protein
MDTTKNGADKAGIDFAPDAWAKSSFSLPNGDNCVEVAFTPDGYVGVRDSKNPDAGHLTFTPSEWEAFGKGFRNNEFDPPTN